jgi:hypothetical protein
MAAALACLVEVPAELDRRPVHLRPAVLRGGEPAGPSARGTIPLGRTRAGREFALAPAGTSRTPRPDVSIDVNGTAG